MVTTTILAVRATPKALLLIQEAEEVKHQNTDASALTPVETIKAAWLCYVPAAVTGASVDDVSDRCKFGQPQTKRSARNSLYAF